MSKMTIKTVYYRGRVVIKQNRAMLKDKAVLHCIERMQCNQYAATHAEVFDEESGVLHCVVKHTPDGFRIVYDAVTNPELMSYYLINRGKPVITG